MENKSCHYEYTLIQTPGFMFLAGSKAAHQSQAIFVSLYQIVSHN